MVEEKDSSKLVDRLKEEFDEHLKDVFEKNSDFKYSDVLTAENLEEVSSQIVLDPWSKSCSSSTYAPPQICAKCLDNLRQYTLYALNSKHNLYFLIEISRRTTNSGFLTHI